MSSRPWRPREALVGLVGLWALALGTTAAGGDAQVGAPNTGPWDLATLRRTPTRTFVDQGKTLSSLTLTDERQATVSTVHQVLEK